MRDEEEEVCRKVYVCDRSTDAARETGTSPLQRIRPFFFLICRTVGIRPWAGNRFFAFVQRFSLFPISHPLFSYPEKDSIPSHFLVCHPRQNECPFLREENDKPYRFLQSDLF